MVELVIQPWGLMLVVLVIYSAVFRHTHTQKSCHLAPPLQSVTHSNLGDQGYNKLSDTTSIINERIINFLSMYQID